MNISAFPGVLIHAGTEPDVGFPACGCDACDEDVLDEVEQIEDLVDEFALRTWAER